MTKLHNKQAELIGPTISIDIHFCEGINFGCYAA